MSTRGKVATLAEAQTAMLARFAGWELPSLQDRRFIIPGGLCLFEDVKEVPPKVVLVY